MKQLVNLERRRFDAWSRLGGVALAVVEGPQDVAQVESLHGFLVLVRVLLHKCFSGPWWRLIFFSLVNLLYLKDSALNLRIDTSAMKGVHRNLLLEWYLL